MKEVEQLIYQRLIADKVSGGVLDLLGEDITQNPVDVTRVIHSHQIATPPSPGLTYGITSSTAGHLTGDHSRTKEIFVTFNIYAQNHSEIAYRLMRLFDGQVHDLSLISGGAVQVGGVSSVFDFEGPDGFDEGLNTQQKDLRFRFFVKPKAVAPI